MKDGLSQIFTDALTEIIMKISGFSLDLLPAGTDVSSGDIIGLMGLNSKKSGLLLISATRGTMQVLCSYMIGIPKDEISNEDMEDALCELVNMTAGNVKARLGNEDYRFTLSTPFIIRGRNMAIGTKKRVNLISADLGNGEISLSLNVIY